VEAGLSLSGWRGQRIQTDRVGGPRNDDRQAGKGTASPLGSIVDDAEDGYANDSPMETTKRFPQGFGNLAKNARFPHSHSQDSFVEKREEQQNRRPEDNDSINN
jgi:hypothetical protein